MIKVNVIAVGKVKEKYFFEGISEYQKRLSKYCEFSIKEVEEINYKKFEESMIPSIIEKESEKILPLLKGFVFATAIEGKQFSSLEFAQKIKNLSEQNGVFTFVIGGSYGLSEKIKDRADELISFSKMTFPHTMFRLMLTEQIYRAFSILSNSSYHK